MIYRLALVASLALSSTAYAETKLPTVDELSDGILAFTCDELSASFIIVYENDNWVVTGMPNLAVTEVPDGFMFKQSDSNESTSFDSLGFLLEQGDDVWSLEFLSVTESYKATCRSKTDFVELLIASIAPKVFENALSLSVQIAALNDDMNETAEESEATFSELSSQISALNNNMYETGEAYEATIAELNIEINQINLALAHSKALGTSDMLTEEQALLEGNQRQIALLNEQLATQRGEMETLRTLLNLEDLECTTAHTQVEVLTQNLNTAMARALLAERRVRVREDALD
jgi:uncharacterized protein YukE